MWRWMSSFGRLDVIVLGLMLAYLFVVVIHVSYRYYVSRRAREIDIPGRRTLAAVLNIEVGTFKSIAVTAPYLGLVGTCEGILSAFGGAAMQKDAFMAMTETRLALALIPTAAAILVVVLATCSYNYLRTRIDLLEGEVSGEQRRGLYFRGARRFPPTKRFSEVPAFGLLAAPALAIGIAGSMTFASFHPSTGFDVELPSDRCEYDGDDRLIILHITDAGKLFIDQEQEDWNSLVGRLSEIYSTREYRTLYLVADSDVSFRTVADALDTVDNATVGPRAVGMRKYELGIQVQLATPKTLNAGCLKPVVTGSSH